LSQSALEIGAEVKQEELPLDVELIRGDFPILGERVRDKPLVYFDNAATTHKPQSVLAAIASYYATENSNIHRGVHHLSQRATFAFERARGRVRMFLNAADASEVVFVRGTTEAINLVAQSYGRANLNAGDEIIVSQMEHHSNIVPWQMLCEEKGGRLRVVPVDDNGELDIDAFERLLNHRTRLVAVTHASNVLGTVNPIRQIVESAHAQGIPVLVDGAQAVPHMSVDVQELDCDFYAFSGHKIFGPTGIGALYGKRALLEEMPPYEGGGSMIQSVSFEGTTFAPPPTRFEAGTPNIAGAIGLEAAIEYFDRVGAARIHQHELALLDYAIDRLSAIDGLHMIGNAQEMVGVISFVMASAHPHDIGTILDTEGVAIRTGHHCAQPLMKRFNVAATARVSLAFYNTHDEIDELIRALEKVTEVFAS
jgi:cysteine desulfurase/selenocysteine lyase